MPKKFARLGVKSAKTLLCGGSFIWRIHAQTHLELLRGGPNIKRLGKMCKDAVDRSQGQLVDITIMEFGDDDLLKYIADRSSRLRRLELAGVVGGIHITKAFEKFPLLEELHLYSTSLSEESIAIVGRCCPMLRTFRANRHWFGPNEASIAIGKNLHELRHLEIIGMEISNNELQVILDCCVHLESLDLRECLYVDLDGEFGKRCSEQIKCLKLPNDSLEGCLYIYKNGERRSEPDYDHSVRPEAMALLRELLGVGDDGLINPDALEALLS